MSNVDFIKKYNSVLLMNTYFFEVTKTIDVLFKNYFRSHYEKPFKHINLLNENKAEEMSRTLCLHLNTPDKPSSFFVQMRTLPLGIYEMDI